MKRTVLIVALALAATASVSCKDSNPNYISFDAQAPVVQATDAKGDLPPPADAAAPGTPDGATGDDGGNGQ